MIGGGIAGIILADHLTRAGNLTVLLIEAGGDHLSEETQDDYQSDVVGLPYTGHIEGRFRAYGGSSLKWGGGLFPFRSIDFEHRPWVPLSGWPIKLADLEPFYPTALAHFGVNDLPFDDQFLNQVKDPFPKFGADTFVYRFAKWAPFSKRNIALTTGREIKGRQGLTILKQSVVTSIELDANAARVDHLVVARPDGSRTTVAGKKFVVCGGGIESARLLLVSNSVQRNGVGNDHDVVGRYHQDHFSVFAGVAQPLDRAQFLSWAEPYFRAGVRHSMKIELADGAQRSAQCLNGHLHFVFYAPEDSGFTYVRSLLRSRQSGEAHVARVGPGVIAADIADLARMAVKAKVANRRGAPKRCELRALIDLEQAPNRDSRITLSESKDRFGVPRARIDWRAGDLEFQTLQRIVKLFDSEWSRLGLGTMDWNPATSTCDWTTLSADAFHHSGATRMGLDPKTSVVDENLKVHGVENLFIASSSVLPTNSGSGPTLTMLALALKLGEHLSFS